VEANKLLTDCFLFPQGDVKGSLAQVDVEFFGTSFFFKLWQKLHKAYFLLSIDCCIYWFGRTYEKVEDDKDCALSFSIEKYNFVYNKWRHVGK